MKIENEDLIKELIKNDYDVPLSKVDIIDFVITETESKTLEDWNRVLEYICWYTKNTREKQFDSWSHEMSFDLYVRYLNAFKEVPGRPVFPEKDMYYLSEIMYDLEKKFEEDYKKKMVQTVNEKYEKIRQHENW